MTEEQLREEIRQLEEEISTLESNTGEAEQQLNLIELVKQQFENVDDLLVDIINADPIDSNKDEDFVILERNGRRVRQSKELQKLHEESSIPKIQIENIYRFNSITLFPISSDSNLTYLGIRFDIFNQNTKQFNQSHYIILHRKEVGAIKGIRDGSHWNWRIFQTTIPKNVNMNKLEQEYLFDLYPETEVLGETNLVGLNMVNKFSMKVYEELYNSNSSHVPIVL